MREDAGLARARAGDDEKRPVDVEHRLALGRIEAGEELLVRGDGHASMLAATPSGDLAMSGRDMASCLARPYASRRDPGGNARRHPARGRDAPACLAGVDRHRGGHAALDLRRSRSGPSWRCSHGRRTARSVGWATAARNWWSSDPQRRDPGDRRRPGHTAARGSARRSPRLPTSTSAGSGSRTTRAGSLDEPGARALAATAGLRGDRRRDACRESIRARSSPARSPPAWSSSRSAEIDDPGPDLRAGPGALPRHPERGLRRDLARGVEGRRSGRAR